MRTINYAGYRMVRGFRSIIYKSNGEIHYISGTDVLPVPLEGEEEKNAIAMLATDVIFSLNIICDWLSILQENLIIPVQEWKI